MQILLTAFKESKGQTIDLVIEHDEKIGITMEMVQWWNSRLLNTNDYRMWYPEDHFSFEWEVLPGEESRIGAIVQAKEKIGEYPASTLRMRFEDPNLIPISHKYSNFGLSSILDDNDEPIAWISHEREETPNGIKTRSIFRFPAETPKRFLEAMCIHCKGEVAHLLEILPELDRQNVV